MFDGRTLKCQLSKSTETPSRCEIAAALGGVALLDLLQLRRHVRDRRVDLARDEEALAERPQDLGELLAALRDQLEHEQERDDAGVGLGEVAEVVVRRDLAGEDRVLLAHPVLDERVADAVDQRRAAGRGDRARHRPAGADVVEDGPAGALAEHHLGEQRGDEVARHELARVVDEEAAVGVAVVGDAERRSFLPRLGDDERAVLLEQRVRLVVREGAVRLEVAADDLDLRQALEHRRQHRAGHAVGGVDDDPKRRDRVDVDEGEHLVDEAGPDVERRDLAALRDRAEAGLGARAHVLEARVATDGQRSGADDLHARVLLRVVRGGDADPAVEPELADRVVDHLGADHPEVADVGAAVRGALHHGGGHRRRGDAHVAADGDRAGLEVLDVGAPDRVAALLVQLRAVEAANVVRLEDPWIEHGP